MALASLPVPGPPTSLSRTVSLRMRAASSSKTEMNSLPMILRLVSGSVTPASFGEEARARVDGDDVEAELVAHRLLNFEEFVLAKHAVVDEDAGEAIADGSVDKDGGNGGVDSAGERADGVAALADFFADGVDGGLDEVFGGPVGLGIADAEEEIAEQFGAVFGVVDFGVELHGPDIPRGIGDSGDGVGGLGGEVKSGREGLGAVAVGHPGGHGGGEFGEEGIGLDQIHFGVAVFAFVGGTDSAAEVMDDVLQSVADAEDWEAEGEDRGIGGRRVSVVDRAGTPGENDADGVVRLDFCR